LNPITEAFEPQVAVIGAGWAGLAAASELSNRGFRVTLYESSHTPGGRARQVLDPALGMIDNGQHLLLGAYQETLRLMARDVPQSVWDQAFTRLPLRLCSSDGQFRMSAPVTSPVWLKQALTLWLAKGLTLKDKWLATQLLRRLKSVNGVDGEEQTVTQWLQKHHQSERLVAYLWEPLCLATLNTDIDQASAWLFQRIIFDALLSPDDSATDLLVPALDLTGLWPEHVCQKVSTKFGHTVREVTPLDKGVRVDGQVFDGCVLAIPAHGVTRLFDPSSQRLNQHLFDVLGGFEYRPITTCYMALDEPFALGEALLMMRHDRGPNASTAPGQWVFDRNRCQPLSATVNGRLAFVISDSQALLAMSQQELAQSLLSQLTRELGKYVPQGIAASRSFHEKRATFAALPHQARPRNASPWQGIVLAGDWTDTGYPSVIEGAVRSGITATNCLIEQRRATSH
jgi:squalene-associated FAD-dependent desaturase